MLWFEKKIPTTPQLQELHTENSDISCLTNLSSGDGNWHLIFDNFYTVLYNTVKNTASNLNTDCETRNYSLNQCNCHNIGKN